MISQDVIEQVRQATDIAQIIGEYVRLKKKGRNFEGLCPFHTEKTPSFKVNTDRQIYHCFGCGKGGNAFSFLMEHEKMTFTEAVKHLASKANITIREAATDFHREELEKLNFAHQVAMEYFESQLFSSKYKSIQESYLLGKRAIDPELVKFFHFGLAGEEWDGLLTQARKKGLTDDDMVKAGLALKSDNNDRYFDRFRQRLMIPIFNLSQKPIAFGGRTLKKGEPAKYINSPETPLYSKSNVLYGLNFSRDHIREAGCALVVEGYFDFISLWQVGVRNVVASSGTAFTQQQARLLARFCDMVYLFFDADSAGQNAALRSVDVLYDSGLDVRVMIPPPGEDPDSTARKFGPDKIEELRAGALGFIPFRVKNVALESTGIIAKEKLVKELSALGAKIGDPTRRALFFNEAATVLAVEPSLLLSSQGKPAEKSSAMIGLRARRHQIEMEYLSLLLSNPGPIDIALESIAPEDLDSKDLHRLYMAMIQQYREIGVLNANRMIERFADEAMISLLTELATIEWPPESVENETRNYVKLLTDRKRKRIRAELQKELAQAEAVGDHLKAEAILQQIKSYGL
jgi:DNA primase